MLEGLEIVELNSKEFRFDNFDFRIDAEYFLKSNLNLLNQLNKIGYEKIDEFSYVTDGIHTSIDYSETSNINLISATSPRENFFDTSRKAFISEEAHLKNPRTALKVNDIIISTVGTIGNCAVVTDSILPANSDRHVGIIRVEKDFLPNYISTFLLTKFGRFQTWRESTGNVQLNLFIYKIRMLKIAKLSLNFQNKIDLLVKTANSKRLLSKQTYDIAETLLLETIGLDNFEPSKDAVNIKSFKDSFLTTGRLDAEYYQKKYEEIESELKKNVECDILDNVLIKIDTGEYSPEYFHKDEMLNLTFYIRSTNIKGGQIEFDDNYFVKKNQFVKLAKEKDIVTARVGSVGIFGEIRKEFEGAVYSDNVLCFHLPEKFISSVYVLLFNSRFYFELIDRFARGSVQQRLNQETLKDLIIPIIDYSIQEKIAALVEESFKLKKQSEQLLETAKRAVEVAIEDGEEIAITNYGI